MSAGSVHVLYRAAVAADEAWSAELQLRYGRRAGDVRYTDEAKGLPHTNLRALYDAKVAADAAWVAESRRVF